MLSILLSLALAAPAGPCADAKTTVAMDICLDKVSAAADAEMARYLAAARKRAAADNPGLAGAIDLAQAQWLDFRKAECAAVYAYWQGGTIRGAMFHNCRIDLTRARTHWLWKTWLTYPDSTPPILPEPGVSADGTS